MDVIDRLPCTDVACARGRHAECSGVTQARETRYAPLPPRLGSPAWWRETVQRMRRRTREAG